MIRPYTLVLVLALLFGVPPQVAHADKPTVKGYVFLGKMLDDGKIETAALDHVPVLKVSAEKAAEVHFDKPVTAHLTRGMKIRDGHSPTATVLGRLKEGSSVTLLSVYVNYGFVWGQVDTSATEVLGSPVRQMTHLEDTMAILQRCNCTTEYLTIWNLDDSPSVVECPSCGATWVLLSDRLTRLDFRPLGGPTVEVILPGSGPLPLPLG